jgi:hypothetical protein
LGDGILSLLLAVLVGQRFMLLASFPLGNIASIVSVLSFGGQPLLVSLRSAHVVCLLVIFRWVTRRLRRSSLFILGQLSLNPNPITLKISKEHDQVWEPIRVGGVEQHVDRAMTHQGGIVNHPWAPQHLGSFQEQISMTQDLWHSRQQQPHLGKRDRGPWIRPGFHK